ncbi:protein of unknown function [Cupriavidus taiwanensis]|uniref:Uncharacterized protein n=1 Tax=Cupriavidus taiwanensis TaxID=164546 RepID=A0A7Z7J919_9BURK|nr:protein of unknown function [Cupriavidus taiwanensis]SPC18589.1 hypothetical protein CBM2594_A80028 [Cupriavidus taiwanensis]SPD40806.1 protein of unknown function [Cupriavidus taiwanensis]
MWRPGTQPGPGSGGLPALRLAGRQRGQGQRLLAAGSGQSQELAGGAQELLAGQAKQLEVHVSLDVKRRHGPAGPPRRRHLARPI